MSILARRWLRAIALGLPLAGTALAGCDGVGGSCSYPTQSFVLTPAELERIRATSGLIDGGMEPFGNPEPDCAIFCREYAGPVGAESSFVVWSCGLGDDGDGGVALSCEMGRICLGGRRPTGLRATRVGSRGPAAWLARSAHLEAASVPAFVELAREIELHDGPASLSRAARRAAGDEVRHARTLHRLARAHGAEPPRVVRVEAEPRSLREVARDNAIEGCVRESFGALIATHQAATACDPAVARAYRVIARDEARHALFSFALHDWIAPRVGASAIDEQRREAIDLLARESERELHDAAILGLPSAERAVELARALA